MHLHEHMNIISDEYIDSGPRPFPLGVIVRVFKIGEGLG